MQCNIITPILSTKVCRNHTNTRPGKSPNEFQSYCPISLLLAVSKLLEKLLLQLINDDMLLDEWIPKISLISGRPFDFQQCQHVSDIIQKSLKCKKYCSAVFLDVQQVFERVWNLGLLFKIKHAFPHHYYLLLKLYFSDRFLQSKFGHKTL